MMSKNELIEKAVNIFGGKWPSKSDKCVYMYKFESENIWECGSSSFDSLFTREEFNAAADRLRGKPDWSEAHDLAQWLAQNNAGDWWWYPAGESPELSGSCFANNSDEAPAIRAIEGAVIGDWRNTLERRPEHIGDANEKIEQISAAEFFEKNAPTVYGKREHPAPANPWFEAGELPPVGTECEVYGPVYQRSDMQWAKVKVYAHVGSEGLSESTTHAREYKLYTADRYRPIKTDKEKAIEFALSKIHNGMNRHAAPYIIEQLYDAGLLRLPDNKKPD